MARTAPTGSRIRARRQALQVSQAHLARQVSISPSYLNLIEHNRRRIGGKLLGHIADALEVDRSSLTEGADQAHLDALIAVAQGAGLGAAEVEQADTILTRMPAWAALIRSLADRITALEQTVDGLNDRLSHDPTLSSAMHEVLSTVSAIRSTASILAGTPEIDPNWLGRFHRNLDEDSRRLARGAEAVVAYFDAQAGVHATFATALEAQAALWDARGHHIAEIEEGGSAAIPALLQGLEESPPGTRTVFERGLVRYAEDAVAAPLGAFHKAAMQAQFDPGTLAEALDLDPARLLRRLAALPQRPDAPEIGLVICDQAGAILHRKLVAGLSLPVLGAACPLWPLFEVFAQPGRPTRTLLEMPDGARFNAWSVAEVRSRAGFDSPAILEGTMLLKRAEDSKDAKARLVGSNCRICTRRACPARREPSMIVPSVANGRA